MQKQMSLISSETQNTQEFNNVLLYKKQILEQEIKQRDTKLQTIKETIQNWHEENELKTKIQELLDFKEEVTKGRKIMLYLII